MSTLTATQFLEALKERAEHAAVFKEVKVTSKGVLQCTVKGSSEPAWFRVDKVDGKWRVSLVTADHGNAEQMLESDGTSPHTAHTTNPVPLLLTKEGMALGVT